MRRNVFHVILIILLVACTTIEGIDVGAASPEETPTISIDPLTSTAEVSETLTVNVTVADIAISDIAPICRGLYAWNFYMTFDPNTLNITSVQKGPFLGTAGPTTFPPAGINNTAGWVMAGELLRPTPLPEYGAYGSGVLAIVTFQVKSENRTLLDFVETKLNTVIEDNNVPIDHVTEDGLFDNTGAENIPPAAIFKLEPPVAEVNETITFNASTSYDPDGWLFSYYWDLGDGTNSSGIVQHVSGNTDMIVEHSYKQAGTYTVTLNVTDYYGETDTATAAVNIGHDVAITEVKAPKTILVNQSASINVTVKNEGCRSETFNVTLYYDSIIDTWTNVSLNVGASTTLIFTWNTTGIPEGTYDILANATIVEGEVDTADNVFPREGSPPVKVTISSLPVHDVAIIEITVSPIELIVGDSVSINVTIENEGTEPEESISLSVYYDSTLIDMQTNLGLAAGAETLRYFTWTTAEVEAGDYSIKAEISVVPGETDEADNIKPFDSLVTVLWYPDAEFTYVPSEPIVGEMVTFNASLSAAYHGTIESYSWNFEDGSPVVVETDPIANHTYITARTYTVTLIVTDNHTLTDTATQSIAVGKMSSTISITLSPPSVTVGENTTMSGSIDPIRESVTVTISYRLKGEETWNTSTAETDENSQYSYIWAPESAGTYEIKASWEGDLNTLANESTVQELTVQEAGPDWILLLVGSALAITILVIIVAYFLKARRTV